MPSLVLPGTNTSPFAVRCARLPPPGTRRAHRSVRAIAIDQASGLARGARRASRRSFDLGAIACSVGVGLGDVASDIPCRFTKAANDLPNRRARTAARLHRASRETGLAG